MTFFDPALRLWAPCIALVLGAAGCSSSEAGSATQNEAAPDFESSGDESIALGDGDSTGAPPLLGSETGQGGYGGAGSQSCLSLMSWGVVAQAGAVPGGLGMDAIVSWLNDSSNSAAEHFPEKPEITSEFLAAFDMILLQDLSGWEFSQDELDVFQKWVEAGGGVMALAGFSGDGTQVLTTNLLLSFSGLNYASVTEVGDTSTGIGTCGYCLGLSHVQGGFSESHPIAQGVTAVGAFQGRSVRGEGEIVAQEDGKVLGMTATVQEGHVFLFHDDWVSYSNLWNAAAPAECADNSECAEVSAKSTYQIAQFWFNSIRYLVPDAECFRIDSSDVTN